jgi:TonB family protein
MRGIGIALASSAILIVAPVNAADAPPHLDTSGVNMQPAYPASALTNGERGAAVIGVNVRETGKVNYAHPLKTSGFDDLDAAAIMGAMNWRFIPAASNGKAVAGDTAVEIVFQPPDPANATAQAAQPAGAPPQPKGDFLPASVQIQAERAQYHEETYPALCPNGTLRSTVEFQHPVGAPAWGWNAAASLMVRAGKDDVVVLQLVGHEMVIPPQESFVLKRRQGDDKSSVSYSHSTILGRPETVSLSWDSTGLVTGMLGAMETHEARLKGPPSQLVLGISSGAANFTNSALICRPG